MAACLILIAHAETAATRAGAFALQESLSARGLAAAKASNASTSADRMLTSPAPAARETAAAFGLNPEIDEALRDIAVGTWTGRTLADIASNDLEGASRWIADPGYAGHGGESIEALVRRMAAWLAARRDDRGSTLAITHAAVVRATVLATLDSPASAFWHIDVAPLARLTLSSNGRRWTLRALTPPAPRPRPLRQ